MKLSLFQSGAVRETGAVMVPPLRVTPETLYPRTVIDGKYIVADNVQPVELRIPKATGVAPMPPNKRRRC